MTEFSFIVALCAVACSFWLGAWFAVATTRPLGWERRAKDARHSIAGNLVILAFGLTYLWWAK